jgi:AcrR family transcriptional regulator
MTKTTKPQRGRPRSDESKLAIYQAALDLCDEEGFQKMTIDSVAARAGVGRQTIYRWWPNLAHLLFDALMELAAKKVAPLDENEATEVSPTDFIKRTFQIGKQHRAALSKMLALAQFEKETHKQMIEKFIGPRRSLARSILFRNSRPSKKQDFFLDVFFGTLWYGMLVNEESLSEETAKNIIGIYSSL